MQRCLEPCGHSEIGFRRSLRAVRFVNAWPGHYIRLLLPLALLALSKASAAQDSLPVAPDLVSVVSGGHWEVDGMRGFYRVRIYQQGWEHVTSTAFLDWIREDPDQTRLIVQASTGISEINDAGVWSLWIPEMEFDDSAALVGISGTHTYSGETAFFSVKMTAPGNYSVVQEQL